MRHVSVPLLRQNRRSRFTRDTRLRAPSGLGLFVLVATGVLLCAACTTQDLAARAGRDYVTEFAAKRPAPVTTEAPRTRDDLGGGPPGLWFVDAERKALARLDPATNKVTMRVDLEQRPTGVAPVGTTAWLVTQVDRALRRADAVAGTSTIVATFARETPRFVTVASGNVWIADTSDKGQVFRFEPATNRVRPPVAVGGRISALAATERTVVVAVGENRIVLIDAASGAPSAPITLPHAIAEIAAGREGIVAGGEGVGPKGPTGFVSLLDVSGALRWTQPTGSPLGHVAVGSGAIWWGDEYTSRIQRLAPADGKVTGSFTTVEHPTSLAAGGGAVYAIAGNGQKLVRIAATDGAVQTRLRAKGLLQSLVWG